MKIGIDLTFLNNYSIHQGVHTYAKGLLEGLEKKKNIKFQIYIDTSLSLDFLKKFRNKKNFKIIYIKKNYKLLKKLVESFYIFFGLLNFHPFKIHYFLTNILNKNFKKIVEKNSDKMIFINVNENHYNLNCKSIINFHDLLHEKKPELLTIKQRIIRKLTYYNSAKYTSKIVASSNTMKNDFLKTFKFLNNRKIIYINEGVDLKVFKFSKIETKIKRKYNLPKKYIFFPAQLWKHKNHLIILKQFRDDKYLKSLNYNLVLTGGKKNNSKQIFDFIKLYNLKNVIYLGKVEIKDYIKIFSAADFLIEATSYTSSSLPIIEAAALKKIIISSNIPVLKEMGRTFKIFYFDLNKTNLGQIIQNISKKKYKSILDYNFKMVKKFSWEKVGEKYIKEIINI